MSRYGKRRNPHLRRNAKEAVATLKDTAMGAPVMLAQVGGGFISSMLIGQTLGVATLNEYAPLGGNLLTIVGSELLQHYVPKTQKYLGHNFTAGAAGAAYVSLMNLLIQKGILSGQAAHYLAPWAPASVVAAPVANGVVNGDVVVNGGVEGMGAVVQQAALYGSPIEQAMQHRMKMAEHGMSGGIFDSKTTLGEYDILYTAPGGTFV